MYIRPISFKFVSLFVPSHPEMTAFKTVVLFLTISSVRANTEYFENFVQMVNESIDAANNYVLPTDNKELLEVTTAGIHDYGSFDFIIVGAGAAGCVLANRLSEKSTWKILLLEAGGEQTEFSDIPGVQGLLSSSRMNWGYYSTPQTTGCLGMINNSCVAPRGKVIGGSSTINYKMFVRGNAEDFNSWVRMGNRGWSYEEVLPHFKRIENVHIYNADEKYRGFHGEIDVSNTDPSVYTGIYLDGMKELGFKTVDYNSGSQLGVSQVQYALRGNRAWSAARGFLDPIRTTRSNLNITLDAFVTNILINNKTKTACGVNFVQNGTRYVAKASREVILSAGAFNTPQILMLSGIGPKHELEELGIDVVLDLPVGKNMQDHAIYPLMVTSNITQYNESLETWLIDYLDNKRPLTSYAGTDSLAFFNVTSKNNSVHEIQQIVSVSPHFNPSGTNLREDILQTFIDNSNPYTDIGLSVVQLHPRSRGNLTLKSSSPLDFPNVNYNYFSDSLDEDIEAVYQGVIKSLDLLKTKAFKAVNSSLAPVISGCDDYETYSREYWYCSIRLTATTTFHPVGTARMGRSVSDSVVSSDLLVHRMGNLRIVDASIMPEITSGNTVAPTMMIADKISDVIKKKHRRSG